MVIVKGKVMMIATSIIIATLMITAINLIFDDKKDY